MALLLSDIIGKARKFINEYVDEPMDHFADETNTLLEAHANVAASVVAKMAPLRFLTVEEETVSVTGEARPDGRKVLRIKPGENGVPVWLRIVEIRVQGMAMPIRTILTGDDDMYAMEWTQQKGVGSGSVRPHAYSPLGDVDMIEIHSTDKSGAVEVKVSMVKVPTLTLVTGSNTELEYGNLSSELLDAVASQTASLYLSATGDEKAAALAQLAQAMLSVLKMEVKGEE